MEIKELDKGYSSEGISVIYFQEEDSDFYHLKTFMSGQEYVTYLHEVIDKNEAKRAAESELKQILEENSNGK